MPGSACDGRVGIGVVGDPGMVFLVGPGGSRPEGLDLRWLAVLRRLAAGAPCRPRQGEDRDGNGGIYRPVGLTVQGSQMFPYLEATQVTGQSAFTGLRASPDFSNA